MMSASGTVNAAHVKQCIFLLNQGDDCMRGWTAYVLGVCMRGAVRVLFHFFSLFLLEFFLKQKIVYPNKALL